MNGIDYTGIPSPQCPNCNSKKFMTWIIVDEEDYEIGMYGTDGICAECATKYTIATPIDNPDMIEMEMEEEIENDEY
jgi:DNA-directed RNA polymerase subunit RPC12/RpoP